MTMKNKTNTKYFNRKGISSIVATTLFIFLSVVAVVIFYSTIRGMLEGPSLSPQISCLEMKSSSILKIESLCYNKQTSDLEARIKYSLDSGEIDTASFTLSTSEISKKYSCGASCANCKLPEKGETKIYYFNIPSKSLSNPTFVVSAYDCALDAKTSIDDCP